MHQDSPPGWTHAGPQSPASCIRTAPLARHMLGHSTGVMTTTCKAPIVSDVTAPMLDIVWLCMANTCGCLSSRFSTQGAHLQLLWNLMLLFYINNMMDLRNVNLCHVLARGCPPLAPTEKTFYGCQKDQNIITYVISKLRNTTLQSNPDISDIGRGKYQGLYSNLKTTTTYYKPCCCICLPIFLGISTQDLYWCMLN